MRSGSLPTLLCDDYHRAFRSVFPPARQRPTSLCSDGLLRDTLRRLGAPHDHQENDRKHGEGNVAVEGNAGVAGCEIACDEHLFHMADRVAEEEDRTHHDRGRLEVQAAPETYARGRANRKVRQAHLELERTDLPADVRRRHAGKEEMKHGRPEARDADRQEQNPREQPIGDRRVGSTCRRKRQRRHEQEHWQVAQDEGDRFGHYGLPMRMGGGLDRGRAAR